VMRGEGIGQGDCAFVEEDRGGGWFRERSW
jgi:hypothetical protein